MRRTLRRLLVLGAISALFAALVRHLTREPAAERGSAADRAGVAPSPEAGVIIEGAPVYDRLATWFLGGLYDGIADDVAATAAPGAHVLDVGCGPGHLLERLANRGLVATGIDLDPAMIERAARRLGPRADVAVADVAELPFEDASFDLVVSTLSMHHWGDHDAGLAEIARVLRPDGRALLFDLAGRVPLHGDAAGPAHHVHDSALAVVSDDPWRWPGPLSLIRRVEARRRG